MILSKSCETQDHRMSVTLVGVIGKQVSGFIPHEVPKSIIQQEVRCQGGFR